MNRADLDRIQESPATNTLATAMSTRRNNMKCWTLRSITAVVLFSALVLPVRLVAQDDTRNPTFLIIDVPGAGTGPGQGTSAGGMDARGTIYGGYVDASNVSHGFMRARNGTITTLDVPGAGTGAGQGTGLGSFNNAGEITGFYADASNVSHSYVRAPDGTITIFDAPGAGSSCIGGPFIFANCQGTYATSINDAGEIAGYYADASGVVHGFLRARDGTLLAFDAPGAGTGPGQGTFAGFSELNNAGEFVGGYIDASYALHGFLRARDGAITTIDIPDAGTGAGQGTSTGFINREGVIVGNYIDASNVSHGFLRARDGAITTFDAPGVGTGPTQGTYPQVINPAGVSDGAFFDASTVSHGYVRAQDGTITTFDAPGAGAVCTGGPFYGTCQGTYAYGISGTGAIVGEVIDGNSVSHGFLRTPAQREDQPD
jgi:hypothetical protein